MRGRCRPEAAGRSAWALVAVVLAGAGCLEEPGRPVLTGVVADRNTTHLALAWLPVSLTALPLGEEVPVSGDATFDPVALVAGVEDAAASFSCEEGLSGTAIEELGLPCATPPPSPTGVRIGLARILGFAGTPQPPDVSPPHAPSVSVADEVEVVWASDPIVRGSREWLAFQTELPAGASLVRRVRCPMIIDPCALCWPFLENYHCAEPVSAEELVLVRPWQGPTGDHRP